MAETITLDKLLDGVIHIAQTGNQMPTVTVDYTVADQTEKYKSARQMPYVPNAQEIAQFQAFRTKMINLIKTLEGI